MEAGKKIRDLEAGVIVVNKEEDCRLEVLGNMAAETESMGLGMDHYQIGVEADCSSCLAGDYYFEGRIVVGKSNSCYFEKEVAGNNTTGLERRIAGNRTETEIGQSVYYLDRSPCQIAPALSYLW